MEKKKLTAEIIGENIKHYRHEKSWTQSQLGILAFGYPAEKWQAAHTKISKFETGLQEPKATELAQLASTLRIDCKQFFNLSIKIVPSKKIKKTPAISEKSAEVS